MEVATTTQNTLPLSLVDSNGNDIKIIVRKESMQQNYVRILENCGETTLRQIT